MTANKICFLLMKLPQYIVVQENQTQYIVCGWDVQSRPQINASKINSTNDCEICLYIDIII